MKTIDEMIAVMQAAKEGKEIECKYDAKYSYWRSSPEPRWDWRNHDYRVKII